MVFIVSSLWDNCTWHSNKTQHQFCFIFLSLLSRKQHNKYQNNPSKKTKNHNTELRSNCCLSVITILQRLFGFDFKVKFHYCIIWSFVLCLLRKGIGRGGPLEYYFLDAGAFVWFGPSVVTVQCFK